MLRRKPDELPPWKKLMNAPLWKKAKFESLRKRIKYGQVTKVQAADPGFGVEASVLALQNGDQTRQLVYGSFPCLVDYATPHGLLLEVDYQEELPDEFYALLAGPDVPSFVLFGEEDTVRGMRMKLDELGRTDVATLYVLHGLPQGKPSYGPRSKAFKSDVLTALIGGLPLDCDSPPYIANLDYPTPSNGYVEFAYLLNIMKDNGCRDDEFADNLVKWAEIIRKTFKEGGVDDIITTRRLEHIVLNFSIFRDRLKAVTDCVGRFCSDSRDSFINLYTKIDASAISSKANDKDADKDWAGTPIPDSTQAALNA